MVWKSFPSRRPTEGSHALASERRGKKTGRFNTNHRPCFWVGGFLSTGEAGSIQFNSVPAQPVRTLRVPDGTRERRCCLGGRRPQASPGLGAFVVLVYSVMVMVVTSSWVSPAAVRTSARAVAWALVRIQSMVVVSMVRVATATPSMRSSR